MTNLRVAAASMLAISLLFAAACEDDSGGKRFVVDESICNGSQLLQMNQGETTRIVLDNTNHSEEQKGMSLLLRDFPFAFKGDLPPNSFVADPVSTVRLIAQPGEEASVVVVPTGVGNFRLQCGGIVGTQSFQVEIPVQIVS